MYNILTIYNLSRGAVLHHCGEQGLPSCFGDAVERSQGSELSSVLSSKVSLSRRRGLHGTSIRNQAQKN